MAGVIRISLLVLAASTALVASEFNFRGSGQVKEEDVKRFLTQELASDGRLENYERELGNMFNSLPKNEHGLAGHQAVRYALHRRFLSQHGWFVRGLEPGNSTWTPRPQPNGSLPFFVKEWVPTFLQKKVEEHVGNRGLNLRELAAMAAAMEDLIRQEVHAHLNIALQLHEVSPQRPLGYLDARDVLGTYFMSFLLANNLTVSSKRVMNKKKQLFAKKYKGYHEVYKWYESVVVPRLRGNGPFSIEQMLTVANGLGEEFYLFNDVECNNLRSTLKDLEGRRAGRVRLSTFYNTSLYSHWRFTEKADYLQTLGALDSSDPSQPSVIIANYVMARPNCLDATNLYAICCRNDCEELMSHLEQHLGKSAAKPSEIMALVENLSSKSVVAPRTLPPALLDRLNEVAAHHGGDVPLHGRLFSQWMHHAFPLDCPFPHEAGTVNPQTPDEWVRESGQASEQSSMEEMKRHVENDICALSWQGKVECEHELTDIPWTSTEELLNTPSLVEHHVQHSASQREEGVEVTHQELAFRQKPQRKVIGTWFALFACVAGLVALAVLVSWVTLRKRRGAEADGAPACGSARRRLLTLLTSKWLAVLTVLGLVAFAFCADLVDGWVFALALVACCALYLSSSVARRSKGAMACYNDCLPRLNTPKSME